MVDFLIDGAAGHQLGVRADGFDLAAVEHNDLVGVEDGADTLGDDQARLRKLMLDPDMRRAATDMLVNAKVLAFLGRSCDADPDSARCDECTSEAGEPRANDSEGEAQE